MYQLDRCIIIGVRNKTDVHVHTSSLGGVIHVLDHLLLPIVFPKIQHYKHIQEERERNRMTTHLYYMHVLNGCCQQKISHNFV